MLDERFVILGFLLNTLGSLTYFIAVLRGHAKPNRVTWFLWCLFPLIAGVAQLTQGGGLHVLTTFSAAFSSFIILLASFFNKKAYWKLGLLDWICGALAVLGCLLWQFSEQVHFAIAFAVFADLVAGVPTIVKAYKAPGTESEWTFLLGFINYGLGLLVIENWDFVHTAFPLHTALNCAILFILIHFKIGPLLSKKI